MAIRPPAGAGSALQPGRRLSHYEIIEKLGQGGMGVVYCARDVLLDRNVALKTLPPGKAGDSEGRSRFLREAKAASALNHPNVVAIYEIESADGVDFIAMEFVRGQTLATRLGTGPIPVDEALACAIQIAEALRAAHAAGLVHRDVKPANIMITGEGAVKLLDFGLAKLVADQPRSESEATRTMLTAVGATAGTAAYMSPEQAQGSGVDARSDIFSFGIVLFQMLSGQIPFPGESTVDCMYAIVHAAPPPLNVLCPGAPESLCRLVARTLEKDPANRPQNMAVVLASLRSCAQAGAAGDSTGGAAAQTPPRMGRWPQSGRRLRRLAAVAALLLAMAGLGVAIRPRWRGAVPKEKKIAVLPFRNIGGQPANQAFCDGMMETVSSGLTQMEQFHGALWVVPATEVRRENIASARDAGRALGANLVITGAVEREGARVRVSANLVNANTTEQLRSRQVTRDLGELSELQDWVIQATADMLDVELQPQARQAIEGGSTTAAAAYDLYLQAEGRLNRRAGDDLERSVDLFKQAIARDPNYALAYDGLAEAYWRLYRVTHDVRWVEPARENSRRALALSDRIPSAYRTMGMIESGSGNHEAAMRALQRSLQLDSSSAATYIELGATCEAMGQFVNSESFYLKATELHPSDWSSLNYLAQFYYRHGRYAEAEALYRRGIELAPANNSLYTNLGAAYWMGGQLGEAALSFEKSLALRPSPSAYTNLGTVYFFQGKCREALPDMRKAVELQPRNDDVRANLADVEACLSMREEAATDYRRAIDLVKERLDVNTRDPELLASLALYWSRLGDAGKALPRAAEARALGPADRTVQWRATLAYELCGHRREALDTLASALRLGQPWNEIRNEPALAALREDAGYKRLPGRREDAR